MVSNYVEFMGWRRICIQPVGLYILLNYYKQTDKFEMKKTSQGFLHRYSILEKKSDSDQTILRDRKTGQLMLMKQIMLHGHEEYKKMIQTLQNQKYMRNEYLLSLVEYQIGAEEVYSIQESLSEQYKVFIIYQHEEQSLANEIQSRAQNRTPFSEQQIWSILYSLVLGLAFLQKEGIGHGCITSSDIFVGIEGQIKVVDPSLSTLIPFQQLCKGYYYAPEMIQNFGQNCSHYAIDQQIDIYKADVFSVAMCILQCCLLDSVQQCYCYQTAYEEPCLIAQNLQQKFNQIHDFYSLDLINVLYKMLILDPSLRLDFVELQQEMAVYMGEYNQTKSSFYENQGKGQIKERISINSVHMVANNCLKPLRIEEEDQNSEHFQVYEFYQDQESHDIADSSPKKNSQNQQNLNELNENEASGQFAHSLQNKCFQSFSQLVGMETSIKKLENSSKDNDDWLNQETSRKVVIKFNKNAKQKNCNTKKSDNSSQSQKEQKCLIARPRQFTINQHQEQKNKQHSSLRQKQHKQNKLTIQSNSNNNEKNQNYLSSRTEVKNQQIFTDPKLLQMMQRDIDKIMQKRMVAPFKNL